MAKESRETDAQAVQTMKTFRDRFIKLRNDTKQSQDEFARTIGVTRSAVGYYEQGKRMPDVITLRRIATTCNVSTDWLLGLTNDKAPQKSAIDELHLSQAAVDKLKRWGEPDLKNLPNLNTILSCIIEDRCILSILLDIRCALIDRKSHKQKLSMRREHRKEIEELSSTAEDYGYYVIQKSEYADFRIDQAGQTFQRLIFKILHMPENRRDALFLNQQIERYNYTDESRFEYEEFEDQYEEFGEEGE